MTNLCVCAHEIALHDDEGCLRLCACTNPEHPGPCGHCSCARPYGAQSKWITQAAEILAGRWKVDGYDSEVNVDAFVVDIAKALADSYFAGHRDGVSDMEASA